MIRAELTPSKRSSKCENPLAFPCAISINECYGTDRSIHVYKQVPKPKPRVFHAYVPLPTAKPKTEAPKQVYYFQPGVDKHYEPFPAFPSFSHYYGGHYYDTPEKREKRQN